MEITCYDNLAGDVLQIQLVRYFNISMQCENHWERDYRRSQGDC